MNSRTARQLKSWARTKGINPKIVKRAWNRTPRPQRQRERERILQEIEETV